MRRIFHLTVAAVTLVAGGDLFAAKPSGGSGPGSTTMTSPGSSEVEQALQRAQLLSRPVLLYFQMQGCSWCRRFEAEVLSQPDVAQRLAGAEVIKADIFDNESLASRYGVRGTPGFVAITGDGVPAARYNGFLDAKRFLSFADALFSKAAPQAGAPPVATSEMTVEVPSVVDKLRKQKIESLSDDEVAEVVTLLAAASTRPQVEEALKAQSAFPGKVFVRLLSHPMLDVRLGALQLLEDQAGENFSFDPWAETSKDNIESLEKWTRWASGDQISRPAVPDQETLTARINDLLSPDSIRSGRGQRFLISTGQQALPNLDQFLLLNPQLTVDQRNRIREVRYAILLTSLGAQDAEALAHRLVFGNLDVRLQSMSAVANLGASAVPPLQDFLASTEPLEREAAVDGILRTEAKGGTAIIAAHLKTERDPNVIHVALREFSKKTKEEAAAILVPFLTHNNEDLVIAALEGLGRLKAKEQWSAVRPCLNDNRWRVRVAALKTISDFEAQEANDDIVRLLSDQDEFVRISAVEAATKLKIPRTEGKMLLLFEEQDALKPVIAASFSRMDRPIPQAFIKALEKSSPDIVLAVIGSLPDADESTRNLLRWAVTNKNDDIACAAIRLVAEEGLDQTENLNLLAEALNSGNSRKIQTVLASARPTSSTFHPNGSPARAATFEPTRMDKTSNQDDPAFLEGFVATFDKNKAPRQNHGSSPQKNFVDAVRKNWKAQSQGAEHIDSGILLVAAGYDDPIVDLEKNLESMTSVQRVQLASALEARRTPQTAGLFAKLLNDPETKVRTTAVESLFEDGANGGCMKLLFQALSQPGATLTFREANNYRIRSRYSSNDTVRNEFRKIYLQALSEPQKPDMQAFLLSLLSTVWSSECVAVAEKFVASTDPMLRRAALFALTVNDTPSLEKYREAITADTSPYVRAILPAALMKQSFYWVHYFGQYSASEYEDGKEGRQGRRWNAETEAQVKKLLDDPDSQVRLQAGLCLLSNLAVFDPTAWVALVQQRADFTYLRSTLSNIFRQPNVTYPDEYRPLVGLASKLSDPEAAKNLRAQFADPSEPITPRPSPPTAVVLIATPTPLPQSIAAVPPVNAEKVRLVYFSKPGCSHCAQVKGMIARVAESFPEIEVVEFNINKNESMEMNESLSEKFGVPDNLRLVAPSIFAASGYLVKDDIGEERLGDLILRSKGQQEPLVASSGTPGRSEAKEAIAQRYARINPGVIAAAGILDGLNPCAFATIIFLLSYLQVARKTPREMAQIGIAYVSGVFCAYFLLGLGLSEIVAHIVVFRQAAFVLNVAMGLFALFIAILSLRDGIRCLQGRLQDMSLQLPDFLKGRIKSVIRANVPQRGFIFAAFGVGAFISLLELACTGQVYAPTILYMIQAGQGGAVGYLLLYNVAFIVPLSVVFVLAFFGLTSGKLTALLQRHAAWVKFGMALLFLVLAFLLFAREWGS